MPRGMGIDRVGDQGGGTPGGGGPSAVPDLAALTAVPTAGLMNGAILGVGTMQDEYQLDKNSAVAIPANSVDIVATDTGVGRWMRKFVGGNSWASQAAWFISSAAGNDEATGLTALVPLRSLMEVFKRLRNNAPLVDMTITLTAVGDTADQDLSVDFGTGASHFIQIVGTRTAVRSASFSAVTSYNDATSVSDLVTDATLPASWTASGLVKDLIRISSSLGVYRANSVVASEPLARQARISRPMNTTTFAEYQPIVGDLYEVYTASKVGGTVSITVKGNGELDFVDCDVGTTDALHGVQVLEGECFFISSIAHGLDYLSGSTGGVIAARGNILRVFEGASPILDCVEVDRAVADGGPPLQVEPQGVCYVATPLLCENEGNNSGVLIRSSGTLSLSDSIAVYDSGASGVTVEAGGIVSVDPSVATVYCFGTSQNDYGVHLYPGAHWSYFTALPTITGSAGDASVGEYPIDWTMLPFTNPDTDSWFRDLGLLSPQLGANYALSLSLAVNAGIMPH